MTKSLHTTATLVSAALVLDGFEQVAAALARRLIKIDRQEAENIESVMIEIIDPIYDAAILPAPMLRMLSFCEDIRGITGLPKLPAIPKDPAAEDAG